MFQEKNEYQFSDFIINLNEGDKQIFSTLGPIGTSSFNTLVSFLEELKQLKPQFEYEIDLQDTFDLVYEQLAQGKASYALIPAAYERVTEYFWSLEFKNVCNFLYSTPKYGIAKRKGEEINTKKIIKVASCPAVEKLFDDLKDDINLEGTKQELQWVQTHSTTEAARCLTEKKVDIAITNASSVKIYSEFIEFISRTVSSEMLWCVFKKGCR